MKQTIKYIAVYVLLLVLGAILYLALSNGLGLGGFWLAFGVSTLVTVVFLIYLLVRPS